MAAQRSVARRCHAVHDQRAFAGQRRDVALLDLIGHVCHCFRREAAVDADHIDAHADEQMLGHDEAVRVGGKKMRGRERQVSTGASGDELEKS